MLARDTLARRRASEPGEDRGARARPRPQTSPDASGYRTTAAAGDALATMLVRAVRDRAALRPPDARPTLQRWPWTKSKASKGPTIKHHVKVVMGTEQPSGAIVPYRQSSVRIQHSEQDRGFLLKVAAMLERIEAALGTGLIDAITASGEKVTIVHGALNYCRGGGTAGSTKLRGCHSGADRQGFADELNDAMESAGMTIDDLAAAVAAGKLPHWDDTRSASPFGDRNNALTLLQPWVAGTALPSQEPAGHELLDVLSLALADHLTHGSGVSSSISFDANLTNAGGGAGVRPPEVGLAHELTHAYYNALGMQLGVEDSSSELRGGRLFELQAVGMKPFRHMPYSENRMRASFPGLAARTNYP